MMWEVAKIRQAELLKEAATQQALKDIKPDTRQRYPARLTIAFATSISMVLPLLWKFVAG
jgi:hypothetical protein